MTLKQLFKPKGKMRIAAFMSGTGSNLRRILENQKESNYDVVMIFSDNGDEKTCNGRKIATEYKIPYYVNDIRDYYANKGHTDRKDMDVRKQYDRETVRLLKRHDAQIVALCGYMSLMTKEVCDSYLTINVHPADLRIMDANGHRRYAGCMGSGCIKKVIESKGREVRSTTHIVTTDLDGGPILMVSEPIEINGKNEHELLEMLKQQGDWKIYPETLSRLSNGRFWIDEEEDMVIDLVEEKMLIRQRMQQIRENMDEEDSKKKSAAIAKRLLKISSYSKANTVMLYIGLNKEVRTREIIKEALAAQKKVVVPSTDIQEGKIRAVQIESLETLKPGAYGIPEPAIKKLVNVDEIEAVVVPGVAFDTEGNRVGYGLGYYDKFLKTTRAKKIALAYEIQVIDKIRATENDVPMDYIITEEKVIEVIR